MGRDAFGFGNLTLNAAKPPSLLHPKQLSTLGDYLRKERLGRNLSQADVAKTIDVTTDCITNWELNRYPPRIKYYPKIVDFLGYDPTATADENSLSNKVLNYRKKLGLSKKRLAKLWCMDESTIGRIEEKGRVFNKTAEKVKAKLLEELPTKDELSELPQARGLKRTVMARDR